MKNKSTFAAERAAHADLVIQIASPEVAAQKLGRTVEAVLARRQELGLPDPLSTRERLERKLKES
jgi:hypothetical protein